MDAVLRNSRAVRGVIRRLRQLLLRGAEIKSTLDRRLHFEVERKCARACAVKELNYEMNDAKRL